MNEIITDIKALQEETLLNLQNSKANNTVRAYKSDFNDFGLFCAQNGFKSLPSEPKIVSLYLTYLSTKDCKNEHIKEKISINRSYS
jgi:site-specific recombinase XerD